MKPLAEQPPFAAAAKEIGEFNAALSKVQGRIAEIEAQLQAHVPQAARDSTYLSAALHFAATGEVKGPDNTPSHLREEHMMLRQQADALVKTLATRTMIRDQIIGELSIKACCEVEGAHAELCVRYVKKLRELDALVGEEVAFIRGIEEKGYRVNMRQYVQWPVLGRLDDHQSMIRARVREFSALAS